MRKLILAVLLFICLTSCTEKNYEVKTIDGVKTVINHELPIEPFSMELIHEISDEGADYMISEITDLEGDSEGNIYILDAKECNIKKFDPSGQFIKNISRKGKGPGEIHFPKNLTIDNNDLLVVTDIMLRSLITFEPDGSYSNTQKMVGYFANDLFFDSENNLIIKGVVFNQEEYEKYLFHTLKSDYSIKDSFFEVDKNSRDASICCRGGRIILNFSKDNKIQSIEGKNAVLSISRHLYTEDHFKNKGEGVSFGSSASHGAQTDSQGNIYTIASAPSGLSNNTEKPVRYILQIFNKEGIQVKNMALATDVYNIRVIKDYIYGFSHGSSIKKYKPLKI